MFGKNCTKDRAMDAARDTLDSARAQTADKASEAREQVGEHLSGWKETVADAAAHAWEMMAHKAGDLAAELAERAAEAAHRAGDSAHARFDEPAQRSAQMARERLDEAKHHAADYAEQAKSRAASLAQNVKAQAPDVLHGAAQIAAAKAGTLGVQAGKVLQERAARYAPEALADMKIVDKKSDFTTKLLWLSVGVFAGVALGVFLAPAPGRRSRALVKDKLSKASHEAADLGVTAKQKAADLSHRASGLAHEVKGKLHPTPDEADDSVIESRVRSALGQNAATRHLERLNVDVMDGVVTLRGPLVDEATRDALESAVRAVKGVRDVKTALLVEAPEEEQAFVG